MRRRSLRLVADKYPSTNPGRLARYYAALCLEDLDKQNQALEELKKISCGQRQGISEHGAVSDGGDLCADREAG